MGEQRQSATYFTFKGGLNTESSDLNAAADEARVMDNVLITSAGTVRRRRGVDFFPELTESASTLYLLDESDYTAISGNYVDPAPSGTDFTVQTLDGEIRKFWICGVGDSIYIYDYDDLANLLDMNNYFQVLTYPDSFSDKVVFYKTQFVHDSNRVYMINPMAPLCFLYWKDDESVFKFETENIKFRDLENVTTSDSRVTVDGKTYRCIKDHIPNETDNKPEVGTIWKEYWVHEGDAPDIDAPSAWSDQVGDLVSVEVQVVGSGGDERRITYTVIKDYLCINSHTSTLDNKPPNATYWKPLGQRSTSTELAEVSYGQLRGPQTLWSVGVGYSAANLDNQYTSSIVPLQTDDVNLAPKNFSCGSLASGRLWLAGTPEKANVLYFSQSVIRDEHYSRMYQWADPYNPDDPDVVESDGGSIRLTNAEKIVGLADYRGGVLVLATNGIWYLTGADGYFKATSYSIQKISDDGCVGRSAWTFVDDTIVYCGLSSINAVSLDSVSNLPTIQSISTKIKTTWTDIPIYHRQAVEVVYNPHTFQLIVGYINATPDWYSERNIYNQPTRMSNFLIFDTRFGAWYRYTIDNNSDASDWAIGGMTPISVNFGENRLVTDSGVAVTSAGENVTVPSKQKSNDIITGLLLIKKDGTDTRFSLGLMQGDTFTDFSKTTDLDSIPVMGTLESVPQLFTDIGHKKQIAYLHTAFERVETGFDNLTDEFINPGGCLYRVIWDWTTDTTAGPRYGPQYQAYRANLFNTVYPDGTLYGQSVVRSKHRVRGNGRAVVFQFQTDEEKDFHLLGWQLDLYANPRT